MKNSEQIPLISVIIPSYNRSEETLKALTSVENQTYTNYEVLVIDDFSEIPFTYDDSVLNSIKIFRHSKNLGAAAARNTGINLAQGEFIAFLDSDDEWHNEKLDKQIKYMLSHPDIDAATTGYSYFTDEGKSIIIPQKQSIWAKRLCKGSGLAPGSTLMVKTNAIKSTMYDTNLMRLEDVDMLLRLVESYNFDVFQDVLATIHRGTRPSAEIIELANLEFIKKNKDRFYSFGVFFGSYCVGKRFLETSVHFFREKKQQQGWKYFLKAIIKNPFQRFGMYLRIFDYLTGLQTHKTLKKITR